MMSPNPYLSSAQQLLNLAHHQAQQMLSLAYEQAQQMLFLTHSQQLKPPSLMSVCEAHLRPACPLAPCSQILYNQSKVTDAWLHNELVRKSQRPKDIVTEVKTRTDARSTHPPRTKSCELHSPAPDLPLVRKSKLPRPIKHSSGPILTSAVGCGSCLGEGKHPITKPTCVIKAQRTASEAQAVLVPEFSKLPKDLVTPVKTQTGPCVKSPKRIESACIMKAHPSEYISESSPTHISPLKQTLTKLEPLFGHEQEPLLVTTAFSSAALHSSVQPSVEHSSATQCSVLASAQLSSVLSSTVPIAEALSVGDLADNSSHSQGGVQAAGLPLLQQGEAVAQEELFLEDLSSTTQGSLMAEQPRAPSASSLPPIPNLGAAALAQGRGPHHSGNHFKTLDDANSSVLMSGMAASPPSPSLMTDADPSYTLASTCSDAEPSVVEPHVKLPSTMPSPMLSSVPLSHEFSSKVPITSHVSAGHPAQVVFEDWTNSHLRHLNIPNLSSEGEPALLADCYSLGSWHNAAPSPLLLEVPDVKTMQFDQEVLEAIYTADHAAALELFSSCLAFCASQVDRTETALLRRNCTRLHLLLQQPDDALRLCHQDWTVDPEDVRTERLHQAARMMIIKQERGGSGRPSD